jgi:O-antigen/teichoic acid export membrane protein
MSAAVADVYRGAKRATLDAAAALLSRRLARDGFWSLLGTLASVVAGVVTVKLVAQMVPPAEYGSASLVLGIVALTSTVINVPLMSAHQRFFHDYAQRGALAWFTGRARRAAVVAAAFGVVSYFIIALAYGRAHNPAFVRLGWAAVVLIVAQPFFGLTTNGLEGRRNQRALAVVNTAPKVLNPVLLFVFLAAQLRAAAAVVLAQALAMALVLSVTEWLRPREEDVRAGTHQRAETDRLHRAAMAMMWALPVANMGSWVMTTADRYIIQGYMTPQAVGVYAMNYGLWSLPFLILNGWLEVLTRPIIYSAAARADWRAMKRAVLGRLIAGIGLSITGAAALYLLRSLVSHWFLSARYAVDDRLILAILVAHCCMVAGYSLVPVFLALKRTAPLALCACMGGAVLVTTEIVWVPRIGIRGAAYATLVAYAAWVVFLLICARPTLRRGRSLAANVADAISDDSPVALPLSPV